MGRLPRNDGGRQYPSPRGPGGLPQPVTNDASLVALGQGVYTVPQTCRILRPSMTARKVHYWLDTELLGDPLRRGGPGVPTLLTFEQVLKVRALQHLRDELSFSLQAVRRGLEVLLRDLVAPDWYEMRFFVSERGRIGVLTSEGPIDLPAAQGVLLSPELTKFVHEIRKQWQERTLRIEGFTDLVSEAAVLGGSPIISGTRIETAFVANLSYELSGPAIRALFPDVEESAIDQAATFEGVTLRAA